LLECSKGKGLNFREWGKKMIYEKRSKTKENQVSKKAYKNYFEFSPSSDSIFLGNQTESGEIKFGTLGLPRVQRSARIRLSASKVPPPAPAAAAAAAAAPAEKRRDCDVDAMWPPQSKKKNPKPSLPLCLSIFGSDLQSSRHRRKQNTAVGYGLFWL
jgi:hypothetical protein